MKPTRSNFYHQCDINTPPPDYDTVVDTKITSQLCKSFDPDTFQKHGFYWVSKGSDVFVTAHTSSGKTLIAEYGILKHLMTPKELRKRVIYTSPIKTLSNQKFYEFSRTIEELNRVHNVAPITIGIITGDTQIRPMSDLLIVTTEILRNYLYSKSEVINNLGCVVFDEVHYLNDYDRGVVWEECLILLSNKAVYTEAPNVQLILLSATIGNPIEICTWLGNLKQSIIHLITTPQRVIPLEYKIVRNGCIYDLTGTFKSEFVYKHLNPEEKVLFNFKNQKFKSNYLINNKKGDTDFRKENIFKQTKPINSFQKQLLAIIRYVEGMDQLPLLIFCLNKRKCTEITKKVFENKKFTRKSIEIEEFVFKSLLNTDPLILECEQLAFCVDLLKRGIAIHHSGLIPIIKEITEMLIINKFIKIVVATETYAMGVNAPMRSVLFLSLYKPESKSSKEVTLEDIQKEIEISINTKRRLLFPNEFIQMSGRAGRRNLDLKGYIYIYEENLPGPNLLKQLTKGSSRNLVSKFRLSNLMVLNVLRSNEFVFKNSFKEEVFKNLEVETFRSLKEKEFEYSQLSVLENNELKELLKLLKEIRNTYELLIGGDFELWEIFEALSYFHKRNFNEEDPKEFLKSLYKKTSSVPLKTLINEFLNSSLSRNYSPERIQALLNIPSFLQKACGLSQTLFRNEDSQTPFKKEDFLKTEKALFLKEEISRLKKELFEFQTRYFKEFERRRKILETQDFLALKNSHYEILLKGEMALELRTLPETFFVNLLISGVFQNLKGKEFLCAVSCLLKAKENLKVKYSEFLEISLNSDIPKNFLKSLERIETCLLRIEELREKEVLIYAAEKIEEVIPYDPCISLFLFEWMSGIPLKTLTKLFGVEEGGVSKLIIGVEEMGRELFNAFEISGIKDFEGFKKEELEILLRKKEIVFESLYLSLP